MTSRQAPSRPIIVGTHNPKKRRELEELLAGLPIGVRTLTDYPDVPEVVEDAETFIGNARKKATELADALGQWVVADDSGLCVDVLDGAPGVLSARFTGPGATDRKNNAKLLELLADVPAERRTAHFICTVVLAAPSRVLIECEGRCDAMLATENRGTSGFGYDPLFIPTGYDRTFAELGPEIKNAISHRARALARLRAALTDLDLADVGSSSVTS